MIFDVWFKTTKNVGIFHILIDSKLTDAMSFYGSNIILDRPKYFGQVPIVLDGSNSFWSGPNHYGQVQIMKISLEKSNLNLPK